MSIAFMSSIGDDKKASSITNSLARRDLNLAQRKLNAPTNLFMRCLSSDISDELGPINTSTRGLRFKNKQIKQ